MCVSAYVCASVCVRPIRECGCVLSCVCSCSLESQTSFYACAHSRANVGGGREGKMSNQTFQVFVAAYYAPNDFLEYIMTTSEC